MPGLYRCVGYLSVFLLFVSTASAEVPQYVHRIVSDTASNVNELGCVAATEARGSQTAIVKDCFWGADVDLAVLPNDQFPNLSVSSAYINDNNEVLVLYFDNSTTEMGFLKIADDGTLSLVGDPYISTLITDFGDNGGFVGVAEDVSGASPVYGDASTGTITPVDLGLEGLLLKVNDSGIGVGSIDYQGHFSSPVRYYPGSGDATLGFEGNGYDINNSGTVLGKYGSPASTRFFIYSGTSATIYVNLPAEVNELVGGLYNDLGQAVVKTSTAGGPACYFYSDESPVTNINEMIITAPAGGSITVLDVYDLTDNGQIAARVNIDDPNNGGVSEEHVVLKPASLVIPSPTPTPRPYKTRYRFKQELAP